MYQSKGEHGNAVDKMVGSGSLCVVMWMSTFVVYIARTAFFVKELKTPTFSGFQCIFLTKQE